MTSRRKRLLVAVDGSEQALDAVRYTAGIVPPDRVELVLFHVLSKVPESFWDLKDNPMFKEQVASVSAWQEHQEEMMRAHMERARQVLLSAGVQDEAITVRLQERRVGIARDIAAESQSGYDGVVLGRRGLGNLNDLILGSIANKLIGKLVNIPVWVVGGAPSPKRILISTDGSEGAQRAADFAAEMLAGSDCDITLIHIVRGVSDFQHAGPPSSLPDEERKWLERAGREMKRISSEMESFIENTRDRFIKAGIDPEHISGKVVTGTSSRAVTIVQEARNGGCGTIVVGRRGLSRVEEFFMGRVSNKIIQLARGMAVWVVS